MTSYEQIILPFYDRIQGFVGFLVRERSDVDDVTQEVFLRAWQCFDQFTPGTNTLAWLRSITRSVVSNWRRYWITRGRHLDRDLDGIEPPRDPRRTIDAGWPDRRFEDDDKWTEGFDDCVMQALRDDISCEHRLVLYEQYFCGYSLEEIGKRNELPIGTVMSRLSRARTRLRKSLSLAD